MDVKPLGPNDTRRVVVGADASTTRDLTALVGAAWNRESNTVDVIHVRAWKPTRGFLRLGKPTIDLDETIGAEVMRLHKAGQLEAVIADPFQLHALIIEWEKAGIRVIELAQSAGRVEADQGLYDAVIGRTIRHYNDPTLNEHIKNSVALETVRGFRLAKEKTSLKIDCAVALSMALWGAIGTKGAGEWYWVDDPFADPPDPELTGEVSASEAEYCRWRISLNPYLSEEYLRRKQDESKILNTFWNAVKRR
jgi:phage terminase large subunit-like protein